MISRTLHHTVLALIVFIWVVPFVALITTSLRSALDGADGVVMAVPTKGLRRTI